MKRMCLMLVVAIVLAVATPAGAVNIAPDSFEIKSNNVYLYNVNTGQVIFERNAHEQCYPASVTKIMTCILALEYVEEKGTTLETEMLVYSRDVQDYLYNYRMTYGAVSLAGLDAGEEISMEDILYGLMLRSGNETAMIIAEHIAGSQEAFAEMMNQRARELGALNTNFVNANGLFDENHYTTAYDMAQLTLHAMELPHFMDIVSTNSYTGGPTNLHDELPWNNTNLVQNSAYENFYSPYVEGVKTGTLEESGRCFVSTATNDGFTYVLVLLGGPYIDESGEVIEANTAFTDAKNIYEWVFDTFKVKSLVERGKNVVSIELRLSMEQDTLLLMTAERFTMLVPDDVDPSTAVTYLFDLPDYIDAPVEKNDVIGTATLLLGGEEVGTVELLASESVSASTMLVLLEDVKGVLRSFWFKFTVVLVVFLIITYIVLMVLRNRRRRHSNYKPRRRI